MDVIMKDATCAQLSSDQEVKVPILDRVNLAIPKGSLAAVIGEVIGLMYIHNDFEDIDECTNLETFPCYGTCSNTPGNYTCNCKRGYSGDAKIQDGCRINPFPVRLLSSEMNCNEKSSFVTNSEDIDLYDVPLIASSESSREYNISSLTRMDDILLQMESPR
ncbi:EGF-like calcium-binding [Artemisia annua]|uniref:EGF-like calcium-binding n=1 Tax=Artemisia annua TaxID=35608 RepID=A0A2U1KUY2_ARTAN|nr:EGF-like calcium-binding [Artemisia annua]